jgi:serine O-acetyltransferase
MQKDAQAILDTDPAADYIQIINSLSVFCAKSIALPNAIASRNNVFCLPRILTEHAHSKPESTFTSATIDVPFMIDHGTGCHWRDHNHRKTCE